MNVLITGGTGMLGTVAADRIALAGHSARLLVRETPAGAAAATSQYVAGDLASGHGVRHAVEGVDAVLHLASDPARPDLVDVGGMRRLTAAARDARVHHMVYVSIVGVDVIPYRYYQCKREAEAILEASQVPYSIVRATQFHGFVSRLLSSLARLPLLMPVPAGFRVQPVDVGDVAERLVRCLANGASHTITNFVGPEVLPIGAMARTWLASQRRQKPVVSIPVPGRLARAFRNGGNVDLDAERGSIGWAEWLERRSRDDRTAPIRARYGRTNGRARRQWIRVDGSGRGRRRCWTGMAATSQRRQAQQASDQRQTRRILRHAPPAILEAEVENQNLKGQEA